MAACAEHEPHDTQHQPAGQKPSLWQRFARWLTEKPEPRREPRPKELRDAPQWLLDDIGVCAGYMYREKPRRVRRPGTNGDGGGTGGRFGG